MFARLANRLPAWIGAKLSAPAEKLDLALSGKGPRSVAARSALFTFAMRVMAAALLYVMQIALARMMGAYEYGIYAIIWVWVLVLSVFASLGYPTGLVRFVPELLGEGRLSQVRTVLIKGPLVSVAFATLIAAVGVGLVLAAPGWFENAFILPIVLAAICLPLMTLAENQDGVAQAFGWPSLVTVPGFVIRPIIILAIFIGMTLSGVKATAASGMLATVIGVWLVTLAQLVMLRRRVIAKIGKGPMEGPVQPWVADALPMLLVVGFFYLITNTDIMVAALFVSPDEVAVYFAATKTLALVHFVSFAIRIAMAHQIAEYHAGNDRAALERTLADALRWTFWPSAAMAAGLLVAGPLILSLFGSGFEQGVEFLAILLVGVIIRAAVGPAESMLTMAQAQKAAAVIYSLVFVVNVGLNFLLIPVLGLAGAAVATALSMTVEALLLVIAVHRHHGVISFVGMAGRLDRSPSAPTLGEPDAGAAK